MSRVRFPSVLTSRGWLVVLAACVAALVVAGALVDAPRSERSSRTSGTTSTRGGDASLAPSEELAQPTSPDSDTSSDGSEGRSAKMAVAPAGGGAIASDSVTTAPETGGSTLPAPAIDARIVRTGTMQLRVRRGGFERAWGDASAVAGAFGGSIAAASRSGSGDGPRTGTITLRVPSARFDAAVARLRGISRTSVQQLDIASQDVTQEYVDVRSRLRHDRAVEGRLLALLAQTDGVGEVLAVQARLDTVQEAIEVSTGRLTYLATVTSTSTIDITLRDPGSRKAQEEEADDEPSVLHEAFTDARESGTERIADSIVWLGGALPTLVLLLVIAFVARTAWTRRQRRLRVRDEG